jgi:hypothetical protein
LNSAWTEIFSFETKFFNWQRNLKMNTSLFKMDRPRTYKKHMKHATDLFWIPKDESNQAIHWRFNEGYSVARREEFPCEEADDMIRKTFESYDGNVRSSESLTDSPLSPEIDVIELPTNRRQFLAFPNGFWSDLQATESQAPVIGPISNW